MKNKKLIPIYSEADRETAQAVLEALGKKGFRALDAADAGKKSGVVLLFLSKAFSADEEGKRRFFAADSAGCEVLPVDLDGAEQSELLRGALIARNAILARGRTPGEIAERVASSELFGDSGLLPRILIAAAALLVLGAGLWLWLGRSAGEDRAETVPALAEEDIAAARRWGLTPEDLAQIDSFTILGDAQGSGRGRLTTDSSVNPGLRVYLDDLGYDSEEPDGRHWYSTQDGHEYTLTHYDDLRVIELMPNLRSLTLVLVETDKLPALKGLSKLEELRLEDCRLGGLEWAAGTSVIKFCCKGCDVEDFSSLGNCPRLYEAEFELDAVRRADFSGLDAPGLHELSIRGGGALREIDLSGLAGSDLWELHLVDLPVRDLNFLREMDGEQQLELRELRELRSVEPLRGMSSLTWLWLNDLPGVRDLTPIGECGRLKSFNMENMRQIRDLDFLIACPSLQRVSLGNCEIEDLDFVETMSKNFGAELEIFGTVRDWSALSNCSFYGALAISPDDRRVSDILPYLENCTVSDLRIGNASDLDLAALPRISSRLSLCSCPNLTDLTALSEAHSFARLELQDLPRLRSLNGLQKIRDFGRNTDGFGCELWVDNCPRLEDWNAINRCCFRDIRFKRLFTLPDFGKLNYSQRAVLCLESIPDLEDLSFLDTVAAPERTYFSFELVDLEGLRDIGALRRFRGEYVAVMPELQEQAEALVEAKRFDRYDIAYPSGGWGGGDVEFALLSFDELETLSDRTLSHVTKLCLVGDQLVDRMQYDVRDEWDGGVRRIYLVDMASGERTEVKVGGIRDLSPLAKLTGLRRLELYALPIESLDGIQLFSELEELWVRDCPKLKDASAAFTLQGLRRVELARSPIVSIRGVQNLTELEELNLYETKIKDLSPLREMDLSAAEGNGGFSLSLGGTDCEDYSPVGEIPALVSLDLNGVPFRRWPDLTQSGRLRRLTAHGCNMTQEGFEAILRMQPELEELEIPWEQKISDLTPLLEMEHLTKVVISGELNKAAETLQGKTLPFDLEIW